MRHKTRVSKLGRSSSHQKALAASLVCNLIDRKRITTTLPKAKVARSLAEKLVTLGRKGDLAARRRALSVLHQEGAVHELFATIVPRMDGRPGGYTRILKLGRRTADSSEMAILEWVGEAPVAVETPAK